MRNQKVQLNVWITPVLLRKISAEAKRKGTSRSEWLRNAATKALPKKK